MTERAALERWLPPTGMSGRFEHFDARLGGGYRLVLSFDATSEGQGKSTADSDVVDVRFIEIEPNTRIQQAVDFVSDDPAFHGTMRLTWALAPVEGGTTVEVRAEDVPPGISAADHAVGLASSLENLAAYVEG